MKRSESFALGEAKAEVAANKRETEHGSWTSYTHSHKPCLFPEFSAANDTHSAVLPFESVCRRSKRKSPNAPERNIAAAVALILTLTNLPHRVRDRCMFSDPDCGVSSSCTFQILRKIENT